MERKIKFSVDEFYHIYNRGNNKAKIFLDNNDHKRFQKLLYVCNSTKPIVFKTVQGRSLDEIERGERLVNINAYCLMPNHFHLIIHEQVEGGITRFMGKLSTAYSMYFNKKNDRTGSLFEGRFKAKHVDEDNYLKYLLSYVHLNPVKIIEPAWKESGISDREAAKKYLKEYQYSSYVDFIGQSREEKNILNVESLPDYFGTFNEFEDFVDEWLTFNKE